MRFALLLLFSLGVSPVYAEVPWKPMLQGLLQRQYYDIAVDYLESLGQSAKCPDDLKNQIDLQTALVHLDALSQGKAPLGYEVHLNQAKNALIRFLKEHPDCDEACLANRNLGKLLLEEATSARTDSIFCAQDHTQSTNREFCRETVPPVSSSPIP